MHALAETAGNLSRSVVAIVLLLSAAWKSQHVVEFRASYRQIAPRSLRTWDSKARRLIVAVEIGVGLALLYAVPPFNRLAPVASIALIGGFTVALIWTPDLAVGCGCWRSSMSGEDVDFRTKAGIVRRNSLLLFAGIVGALSPAPGAFVLRLAAAGAAVPLAVLVLETPTISSVVSSSNSQRMKAA
jgi:methylamine utilization protein MauE